MKPKLLFALLFFFVFSTGFAPDPTDLIINGEPCGPHGSAKPGRKEFDQNVFKNRFDFPKAADFITSVTLETIKNAKETQAGFSQNKAIEVEGFVFDVKKGGIETCNCKATESLFRDTHIELTINSSETGAENRVIVEVTPRFRQMVADNGTDWTTETLRQTIKGKFVRLQGWLFYDFSHKNEAFAEDPDNTIGKNNWRASAWEVHPVTSMEIIESDNIDMFTAETMDDETSVTTVTTVPGPNTTTLTTTETSKVTTMNTASPVTMLVIIILGAILGMVGQGVRVIVGLKKLNDTAALEGKNYDDLFKTRQLVMSLFIAFAIGAIAGVLAALTKVNSTITQAEIIAFVAAGYAGTDFIEGFMKKNPGVAKSTPAGGNS